MSIFIILGVVLFLFVSTIGVLQYESVRGVRFFRTQRERFDVFTSRVGFVLTHVDFSSFTMDLVKDASLYVIHVVLHYLLLGIRFLERILTRTVRGIRVSKAEAPSDTSLKTTSAFLKKIGKRGAMFLPRMRKREEEINSTDSIE